MNYTLTRKIISNIFIFSSRTMLGGKEGEFTGWKRGNGLFLGTSLEGTPVLEKYPSVQKF